MYPQPKLKPKISIIKIFIIFALVLSLICGVLVYKYYALNKVQTQEILSRNIDEYNVLLESRILLFKLQNLNQTNNTDNIKDILLKNQNKTIIINFWASWCSPCVKEIPLLNKFYQNNHEKVEIIGIAADSLGNIKKFNEKIAIDYYVSIANLDAIELSKKLGNNIGALPYTLVIKNKKIIDRHIGELEQKHLDKWINF